MKKLLIILMVIAMVSFLYAGCTPTTPAEEVEEEVEEEELAPTDTPTISSISGIDITSDSTQYINKDESADDITVEEVLQPVQK